MNAELEFDTAVETVKTDETLDVVTLTVDDLDLVGGGLLGAYF